MERPRPVFMPSDFAIINTDGHSDFDIEESMALADRANRKLKLKLNYMCAFNIPCRRITHWSRSRYPDSGGAFRVQIYSPFILVNKSGLPFAIRSTRSTRAGTVDVAGETNPGELEESKHKVG